MTNSRCGRLHDVPDFPAIPFAAICAMRSANRFIPNDRLPIKEANEDIYDEIASLIENTIYENNFRMVESAEAIGRNGKIYGISSRKTLYKFIINNQDRFSDNFLRDPKLIRVLERYSSKYQ